MCAALATAAAGAGRDGQQRDRGRRAATERDEGNGTEQQRTRGRTTNVRADGCSVCVCALLVYFPRGGRDCLPEGRTAQRTAKERASHFKCKEHQAREERSTASGDAGEFVFKWPAMQFHVSSGRSIHSPTVSANFSILRHDWKGSCNSLPLMTTLGKSSRCTSSGSSKPLRVTMICFGCSSVGRARINAAVSSAVFHLANWPRRF